MTKYRATENLGSITNVQQVPRPSFGFDALIIEYGLGDIMEVDSDLTQEEQTLDQEYNAYITAALSPRETDILKFWEVSINFVAFILANPVLYRCQDLPTQRSLRSL